MRRLPAFVAVTALAGFGLVGCSASAGDSCPPPANDSGLAAAISATGDFGSAPTVTLRSPFVPSQPVVDVMSEGHGERLTQSKQLALVDVTVMNAATGEKSIATTYSTDLSKATSLPRLEQNVPGLTAMLQCAAEGSRVAVAIPFDRFSAKDAEGLGLQQGDAAVFVVDMRKVFLPAADGADQFNGAWGMPSVVRAPDGQPGVVIPDGNAPTDVRTETIKKGDGDTLTADSNVVIHLLGVAWGAKTSFASTWDNGAPGEAQVAKLPPALSSALTGQTVGSQVLVVVPADQTAPDQQVLKAPADKALVYVVDILGVVG